MENAQIKTMIYVLNSELGAARRRAEEEKQVLQLGEVLKQKKRINDCALVFICLRKPRCPEFLRSLFFMGSG